MEWIFNKVGAYLDVIVGEMIVGAAVIGTVTIILLILLFIDEVTK